MVCLHQIKLTYGRRLLRLHQHPASGGWGSGGRDHSIARLLRPYAVSVRPPGSGRTDQVLADGVRLSPAPPSSRPPHMGMFLVKGPAQGFMGSSPVVVSSPSASPLHGLIAGRAST